MKPAINNVELTLKEISQISKSQKKICYEVSLIIKRMLTSSKNRELLKEINDIGDMLYVTRERVRQIEVTAIKKLKQPNARKAIRSYTGY